MILPDGSELAMRGKSLPEGVESLGVGVDGKPLEEEVVVTVFDQSMFLRSVLRADIGLGESYMDGHFDCDLYALLDLLCSGHPANVGAAAGADSGVPSLGKDLVGLVGSAMHWLGAKMEFAAHAALSNTKEGSKKNIEYHYDAGNAFYRLFLDDTMLYSSGIHQPLDAGPCTVGSALGHIPEDDFEAREKHLEEAQYAKIDAMLDRLDLQPNDHILEIGCGWGACAIRAARRAPGIRVTGLTISNEQFAEAKARVKAAGLENRVDIVMRDYRDVAETYDKVISVEMLEAVGHEHLPTFFSVVSRALKPGGKAAIQVITMPDERYESYCKSESDFIRAYIFPGGHLPSVGAMTAAASAANLRLASYDDIGEHYAVTLRLWRERMMARAETVLGLGYSSKFLRMFEFYFAYCEAGFAHRLIHDLQMTWVKDGADAADDPRSIATASATAQASVRERDASWFLAAISLVAWTAHACATRSRWAPAIFVAVAAAAAAHFFILVAVAAALAAIGAPDKTTNDALLARAARTARPLTSAALSFAAAVAAAATTTNGAATSLDSLADHLSAARGRERTPPRRRRRRRVRRARRASTHRGRDGGFRARAGRDEILARRARWRRRRAISDVRVGPVRRTVPPRGGVQRPRRRARGRGTLPKVREDRGWVSARRLGASSRQFPGGGGGVSRRAIRAARGGGGGVDATRGGGGGGGGAEDGVGTRRWGFGGVRGGAGRPRRRRRRRRRGSPRGRRRRRWRSRRRRRRRARRTSRRSRRARRKNARRRPCANESCASPRPRRCDGSDGRSVSSARESRFPASALANTSMCVLDYPFRARVTRSFRFLKVTHKSSAPNHLCRRNDRKSIRTWVSGFSYLKIFFSHLRICVSARRAPSAPAGS